jgi:hypothetical protein
MDLREIGCKVRKWKRAEDCDYWQVLVLAQLDMCVVLTGGWHIAHVCWQVLVLTKLHLLVLLTEW